MEFLVRIEVNLPPDYSEERAKKFSLWKPEA